MCTTRILHRSGCIKATWVLMDQTFLPKEVEAAFVESYFLISPRGLRTSEWEKVEVGGVKMSFSFLGAKRERERDVSKQRLVASCKANRQGGGSSSSSMFSYIQPDIMHNRLWIIIMATCTGRHNSLDGACQVCDASKGVCREQKAHTFQGGKAKVYIPCIAIAPLGLLPCHASSDIRIGAEVG